MIIEIRRSFEKDAEKLSPSTQVLLEKIIQTIMSVQTISDLPNYKKLKGFKTAYRLRLGSYRIGFFMKIKR